MNWFIHGHKTPKLKKKLVLNQIFCPRDYSSPHLSQCFSVPSSTVLMRWSLLTYSQPVISVRWYHPGSFLLPLLEIENGSAEWLQVSDVLLLLFSTPRLSVRIMDQNSEVGGPTFHFHKKLHN